MVSCSIINVNFFVGKSKYQLEQSSTITGRGNFIYEMKLKYERISYVNSILFSSTDIRAVQRLSAAEFQVRLFSSLQLVVAATGLRTRSRHACDFFSRLNHLAPGQPPLLAARSPDATGLASSLIDCFFSQSSGVVFNIAGPSEIFHAACLALVTFPLRALFLSAFQRFFCGEFNFFIFELCQSVRTVLIRSSNQSLFWQLRFIQARNLPELLNSTWNGFSSLLASGFSFAFGARERARDSGEFCLRHSPFGQFERSQAYQPNPTFPRLPGIILETFNLNLSTSG
jgi:hypothetical protein